MRQMSRLQISRQWLNVDQWALHGLNNGPPSWSRVFRVQKLGQDMEKTHLGLGICVEDPVNDVLLQF